MRGSLLKASPSGPQAAFQTESHGPHFKVPRSSNRARGPTVHESTQPATSVPGPCRETGICSSRGQCSDAWAPAAACSGRKLNQQTPPASSPAARSKGP